MNRPRSLDEARRLHPNIGISVYAIEPRGAVTLEILDGETSLRWTGATEAEVWDQAFPTAPETSDLSADMTPETASVFD